MVHALILACCFVGSHPARWAGVNLGLAVADYETAHAFQYSRQWNPQHTHWTNCTETNPLFGAGTVPHRATFYTRGLPIDVAIEATGYLVRRKLAPGWRRRMLWHMPFAAVSYAHISGIASNLTCR